MPTMPSCLLLSFLPLISLVSAFAVEAATAPVSYTITTIAGTGQPGYSGDGRAATAARLSNPYGLTRGPDKALYVCEVDNHVIRRVARDGTISTAAGCGDRGYSGDGGPAL